MVPRAGVEPARPFGQRILSPGTARYLVLRNETKQDVRATRLITSNFVSLRINTSRFVSTRLAINLAIGYPWS